MKLSQWFKFTAGNELTKINIVRKIGWEWCVHTMELWSITELCAAYQKQRQSEEALGHAVWKGMLLWVLICFSPRGYLQWEVWSLQDELFTVVREIEVLAKQMLRDCRGIQRIMVNAQFLNTWLHSEQKEWYRGEKWQWAFILEHSNSKSIMEHDSFIFCLSLPSYLHTNTRSLGTRGTLLGKHLSFLW